MTEIELRVRVAIRNEAIEYPDSVIEIVVGYLEAYTPEAIGDAMVRLLCHYTYVMTDTIAHQLI